MLEQHKSESKSMKLLWLYFSFQGRISRKQYWIFYLIPTVIGIIIALMAESHLASDTKSLIEGVIILVFAWPSIAVLVKRYHDIDKSGWWFFITLIPIIGTIWCFIETAVFRGTEGNNRFGPNPVRMCEEISSTSNTVRQQPLSNFIDDKGSAMRWTWPTVWADERGGWWKLLTTLAMFAGGAILGLFLVVLAVGVLAMVLKNEPAYVRHIEGPNGVLEFGPVFGFGLGGLAGLLLGIRQVHNKPVACVFTDGRPFNFGLAFQSVVLWGLMIFLYSRFWTTNGVELFIRRTGEIPPAWWLVHLVVVLCAVALLQTSTVVLFWGYLLPRVAAWVKRSWLAVCILAVLFNINPRLFSGNLAVGPSYAHHLHALVSGIILGAACIRAGTLAPLIGANIVSGLLMILLYPNTNISWSYVVFEALAMATWFVWLLWATRSKS